MNEKYRFIIHIGAVQWRMLPFMGKLPVPMLPVDNAAWSTPPALRASPLSEEGMSTRYAFATGSLGVSEMLRCLGTPSLQNSQERKQWRGRAGRPVGPYRMRTSRPGSDSPPKTLEQRGRFLGIVIRHADNVVRCGMQPPHDIASVLQDGVLGIFPPPCHFNKLRISAAQ